MSNFSFAASFTGLLHFVQKIFSGIVALTKSTSTYLWDILIRPEIEKLTNVLQENSIIKT